MGLHGVVKLEGSDVRLLYCYVRFRKACSEIAAPVPGRLLAGIFGPARLFLTPQQIKLCGLFVVLDLELASSKASLCEGLCNYQGDRLTVVMNFIVLKNRKLASRLWLQRNRQPGSIEGRKDCHNAGRTLRAGAIDGRDRTVRNSRLNHQRDEQVLPGERLFELSRVGCLTGHFGKGIVAVVHLLRTRIEYLFLGHDSWAPVVRLTLM